MERQVASHILPAQAAPAAASLAREGKIRGKAAGAPRRMQHSGRHAAMFPEDGASTCRYEFKYLVPEGSLNALRAFIQPFTRPDRYAARWESCRYPVYTLYLDSPDLRCYQAAAAGHRSRYKLRVRSYVDDGEAPVFLEVKERRDQVVLKRRAVASRSSAAAWLRGEAAPAPQGDGREELLEFVELCRSSLARPVLWVCYWREVYVSSGGDPLRINFDTAVFHAASPEPDLRLTRAGWQPTPLPGAIMEIKFTERSPSWVRELVWSFGLERRSISKYALSLALARGDADPSSGSLLPSAPAPVPRRAPIPGLRP